MALAGVAGVALRTISAPFRRTKPQAVFPSLADLERMGPERVTAWHRASGVEARVVAGLVEAEGDAEQAQAKIRVQAGDG